MKSDVVNYVVVAVCFLQKVDFGLNRNSPRGERSIIFAECGLLFCADSRTDAAAFH